MIIQEFEGLCRYGESMEIVLPKKGLKLDPRANLPWYFYKPLCFVLFSIHYHDDDDDDDDDDGMTVTLTRIDKNKGAGYSGAYRFFMKVYDPTMETVPDFTSTVYMYHGLDGRGIGGEYPPKDTTEIILHPSTTIIHYYAFRGLTKLRRIIMNDTLEIISHNAFRYCTSLDAIFLPASIRQIDNYAFSYCTNLKIVSIPSTIDIENIGKEIVKGCRSNLLISHSQHTSTNTTPDPAAPPTSTRTQFPPLHQVCLDRNVTAQSIRQCITTYGSQGANHNANLYSDDRFTVNPTTTSEQEPRSSTTTSIPRRSCCCSWLVTSRMNLSSSFMMNQEPQNQEPQKQQQQLHSKMTPMHILVLNPYADTDTILELFHVNMHTVFEPYDDDDVDDIDIDDRMYLEEDTLGGSKTPLDALGLHNVEAYLSIILALCKHREMHV